jgi:hypothetical protein
MRYLVSAGLLLAVLTGCGGGKPGATETVTETVTVTAEPVDDGEDVPTEGMPEEEPPAEGEAEALVVDEPFSIGPDDEGGQAVVTLHSVTYPKPDEADTDSLEDGNVFVQVEWTIKNTGPDYIYGIPVYPSFETSDGQVRDAEWEYVLNGKYGSKGFEEEVPDSLRKGQFAKGWNIYEIPRESGELIFSAGPGEVRVAVNPPA